LRNRSRDKEEAEEAARKLGIPKFMVRMKGFCRIARSRPFTIAADHCHVPWSIKAAETGKHVLCRSPFSITVAEARRCLCTRDRLGVKIGEAFCEDASAMAAHAGIIRSGASAKCGPSRAFLAISIRDPGNVRTK